MSGLEGGLGYSEKKKNSSVNSAVFGEEKRTSREWSFHHMLTEHLSENRYHKQLLRKGKGQVLLYGIFLPFCLLWNYATLHPVWLRSYTGEGGA